jgi:DNA polymerase-3 subunit delta'
MSFTSIIGQPSAKSRLGHALAGTPGHAYIFLGPDGIGKTLLAREFAKALLCQSPDTAGACDQCPSCRHFANQVHPDFCHVQILDKDKVIKVERVRQAVGADIAFRPQFGSRKVYLVDADDLNEQGQNALLKSLEEPPAGVVFLLTAVGPERLLPTILSRAALVPLQRYSPREIEAILAGKGLAAGDSLAFYTRFANGLAGAAIDLAASGWFAELRNETLQFFQNIGRSSRTALLTAGYQFFETNKPHVPIILDILGSLVRDWLAVLGGAGPDQITNLDQKDLVAAWQAEARRGGADRQRLQRAYAALLAARRAISLNASFESLICHLLLLLRKEFTYA